MNKLHFRKPDADIDLDWDTIHKLPLYYVVNNAYDFLLIAAYYGQRPIGVTWDEYGYWCVVFEYSKAIKYREKYPEDHLFSEQQYDEFRKALSPQDSVCCELLEEMEQEKTRIRHET